MEPLSTFIINDVIKSPDVAHYIKKYRSHLAEVFG